MNKLAQRGGTVTHDARRNITLSPPNASESLTSNIQATTIDVEKYTKALIALRDDLREYINDSNTNPIMLRTAWHDAGSYSGANGSIRFEEE